MHTLVAMFNDEGAARKAQSALAAAGLGPALIYREQAGSATRRAARAGTCNVLTLLLPDESDVAKAADILQPFAPDAIDAAMAARLLALRPGDFS